MIWILPRSGATIVPTAWVQVKGCEVMGRLRRLGDRLWYRALVYLLCFMLATGGTAWSTGTSWARGAQHGIVPWLLLVGFMEWFRWYAQPLRKRDD